MNRKRKADSLEERVTKIVKTKDKECVIHDNFDQCSLYNCPGLTRERINEYKKNCERSLRPLEKNTESFNLYS